MDIQKYIDEIKNAEKEEPIRGVEMDTILHILEKLRKEFDLTAVDTRPRPRIRREVWDDIEFSTTPAENTVSAAIHEALDEAINRRGQLWHMIDASMTLTAEERRIALEYVERAHPHNDFSLQVAFTWSDTPQGSDFWFDVNTKLEEECEAIAIKTILRASIPTQLKRLALYGMNKLQRDSADVQRRMFWRPDAELWMNMLSWEYLPPFVGEAIHKILHHQEISEYEKSFYSEPNLIKLSAEELWNVTSEVMSFRQPSVHWRGNRVWTGVHEDLFNIIFRD